MEKDKKSKKGTRQQAKREEKPPSKAKNQKKKVERSDDESSDNEEVQTVMPTQKKKPVSIFAMLADDDGDDKSSESEDSDPEPTVQKKPIVQVNQKNSKKQQPTKAGKKNQKEEEDFDAVLAEFSEKPVKTTAADKKGKKNKKGAQDVDEIFENLKLQEDLQNGTSEQPAHPQEQKKAPEIRADMTADELAQIYEQMNMENEEDDDGKRKKKKGNKQQQQKKSEMETPKSGDEESDEDDYEDGSTVKSAAQKKKEKKERQKAEKLLKAQQAKTKPPTEKTKKEGTIASQEPPNKSDVQSAAKPEVEVDEDNQPSKKDKKKKKGDAKEEEKTKKSNKMVSKILEAQRLLKEEEERKRREEEEKMRKEEEEQRLQEEKERLEREKKERKKQKEKERIKRLKAEGKFLTEKQKEDRKRAQQMLESYKAQGVEVPLPTDKIEAPVVPEEVPQEKQKRVVYTRKAKAKAQQQTSSVTPSVTTPTETEQKPLVPEAAKEEKPESEEDVKDNWDDSSDSDDDSQASGAQETTDDVHQKCQKNQAPNASDSSKDDDDEEEEDDEDDDGDDDDDDSSSEDEDDEKTPQERAKEKALAAIEKRKAAAEAAKSADKLRAPVICVLGHVDTGKTKILDKLRRSHVQDGEAGGITQQIGATNVPHSSLKEQIKMCKEIDLKIPGLLIIDTPGHESFSNLRTRGSSLCDIAILVVDIMHGLEPQTIESINILKQKKTPFIVALNKIDRLFGWVTNCHADIVNQLKKQKPNTKMEFDERAKHIIVQFAEQGLNARLFYENTKPREFISLVPTSATTGDGVGNLMALICELTQTMMLKRIMLSEELQATVMEVKAIAGHGTTIDVILVNGKLAVGNTIVVAGQEGPIVTQIRSLLLPPPMHEIRVKSNFESHKEVLAAQGCKIAAKDLEKAIAGLPLYVAHSPEEVEIYREELSQMLKDVLSDIKVSEKGVYVQASTLGSLESLLSFLKSSKIPFSGINIGPVHKRDVMKTMAMLEHDPLFACILAFDVKVEKDAQEMAESNNIQIFQADIIYHLFDNFTAFRKRYYQQKQEEFKHIAMFPCKVRIMPEHIFNSRDPIICGVVVEAGFVKEGTILCVPSKNFIDIGRVSSLEVNHKQVEKATKGMEVCIKIDPIPGDAPKMVGRHFEVTDELVSKISRNSIDAVKNWFRDDMDRADWQLIVELKKIFGII